MVIPYDIIRFVELMKEKAVCLLYLLQKQVAIN
jgi:hypothetical protein